MLIQGDATAALVHQPHTKGSYCSMLPVLMDLNQIQAS